MKTEFYTCDIEKCGNTKDVKKLRLQVLFTTEQTEGRSVPTYLSDETLDICNSCLEKIKSGNYVYAHGAQGYNTFYFKTK